MPTPSNDQRPGLRPPQFGLRTLLLVVTLCGAIFALSQWLPPMAVVGLAFLALIIFAHVAGNSIGTRLRELGSRPARQSGTASAAGAEGVLQFAPVTRLGQRYNLGWPVTIATLAGLIGGGAGGGLWTLLATGGPVEPLAVAVGAIAFAALGAIAAFATFGFTQVLLGAMWQAMRNPAGEPDSGREFAADKNR